MQNLRIKRYSPDCLLAQIRQRQSSMILIPIDNIELASILLPFLAKSPASLFNFLVLAHQMNDSIRVSRESHETWLWWAASPGIKIARDT